LVRRLLHSAGYRYRLHGRSGSENLPGRPDLVFASRRKVVFVNGCFWHSHDCRAGLRAPLNNAAFWQEKRRRTVERDAAQIAALHEQGWQTLVVWECQLKDRSDLERRLVRYLDAAPHPPAIPHPYPSK
jgi:DNA mismatch endonuclease (patch repair protein)